MTSMLAYLGRLVVLMLNMATLAMPDVGGLTMDAALVVPHPRASPTDTLVDDAQVAVSLLDDVQVAVSLLANGALLVGARFVPPDTDQVCAIHLSAMLPEVVGPVDVAAYVMASTMLHAWMTERGWLLSPRFWANMATASTYVPLCHGHVTRRWYLYGQEADVYQLPMVDAVHMMQSPEAAPTPTYTRATARRHPDDTWSIVFTGPRDRTHQVTRVHLEDDMLPELVWASFWFPPLVCFSVWMLLDLILAERECAYLEVDVGVHEIEVTL